MGSKMAAASRVVQAVRPHAPLIKFPDRLSTPRPSGLCFIQIAAHHSEQHLRLLLRQTHIKLQYDIQEALKMVVGTPAQTPGTHSLPQSVSAASRPPGTSSVAPRSHTAAPPDTAATIAGLPPRYRRRTIATEEMDYIQRGGPE